ncbi:uncharacterized protein YggU (UPF0235/DUF167 family) [Crossiella equi]|uniref:Uncharacterized protein YggU (UPF0235/DUF167 family) n=1 Tax=Crossiella equi TaxID=130796 RepID=A0ABS5AAC9_9PSEU|nr:DUF3710 domain-containing protein [Crossiella equi]MBP2473536.1 uncharacterized protein YggU (UPF0235/DUF167 family) [Crossiella equi]
MFGFGRRKKRGKAAAGESQHAAPADVAGEGGAEHAEAAFDGPYDEREAPQDQVQRLDLGSVRVPVPEGAQLQVEVAPEGGEVQAVHLMTEFARLTVSAFAAPRSGGLWKEVSKELSDQLKSDGARVVLEGGDWGTELVASGPEMALRFVGVDGPRWMLRAVVASPPTHTAPAAELLRDVVRGTVVVRGDSPMPVRTPLPLELPPAIAAHIAGQQG